MKIIVATHGDFCFGIIHSYKMLAGDNESIIPISLKESDTGEFKRELKEITSNDEKYLILCDLYGGTPFNESIYLQQKYPDRIKTVSGVNLPMLLESGMALNTGVCLDKIVSALFKVGAESIMDFSNEMEMANDDDIF